MLISDLNMMQDALRNGEQIADMYRFVKGGGRFDAKSITDYTKAATKPKLISILRITGHAKFKSKLWLRDGNHRVVSISFCRNYLYEDEYYVEEYPHYMMEEINFSVGWITPFDPWTHVRRAEFGGYRKKVYEILQDRGEIAATAYVLDHKSDYCVPRTFSHETINHLSGPWSHLTHL